MSPAGWCCGSQAPRAAAALSPPGPGPTSEVEWVQELAMGAGPFGAPNQGLLGTSQESPAPISQSFSSLPLYSSPTPIKSSVGIFFPEAQTTPSSKHSFKHRVKGDPGARPQLSALPFPLSSLALLSPPPPPRWILCTPLRPTPASTVVPTASPAPLRRSQIKPFPINV